MSAQCTLWGSLYLEGCIARVGLKQALLQRLNGNPAVCFNLHEERLKRKSKGGGLLQSLNWGANCNVYFISKLVNVHNNKFLQARLCSTGNH